MDTNKIKKTQLKRRIQLSLAILSCGLATVILCNCVVKDDIKKDESTIVKNLPDPIPINDSNAHKEIFLENPGAQKITDNMLKQISIVCANNTPCLKEDLSKYRTSISETLLFLVSNFGAGHYDGKVEFIISRNSAINGRMLSHQKNPGKRQVIMNEINMGPTEWRVIVHELFHAFYQTNSFIDRHPDFFVEGLATYAEYLYYYRDKNKKEVLHIMKNRAKSLGYKKDDKRFDYNMDFSSLQPENADLLYQVSALFFMSQEKSALDNALKHMFIDNKIPGQKHNRESFDVLAKKYSLELNEYISMSDSTHIEVANADNNKTLSTKENTSHNYCDFSSINDKKMLEFLKSVMDKKRYEKWRKANRCKG